MTSVSPTSLRTRFVLDRRGRKNVLDPLRAYGAFVEEEPAGGGALASVATLLLTNRECPWRCVYCDLWKNTLDATVPLGAISAQIRRALAELPSARWIKLYNAGSFFDPAAIPPAEWPSIADLLAPFERVIVESHPALVGDCVVDFRDRLEGRLEVAMGLEVADDAVLGRLNRGTTLEIFARAADFLRREAIDLRAFVLVQPPFSKPADALALARRSLDFARACGARVSALLPTRGGNGAMETLSASGDFTPPRLSTLEAAFDLGLQTQGSVVLADVWDLELFSDCPRCFPARRDRLVRMNRSQRVEPRVACAACPG